MENTYPLNRFVEAHRQDYARALGEIRNGKKCSHWMWYIFPQLRSLGKSPTAEYYGISGAEEAAAFLAHPYLGANLIEISQVLLQLPGNDPVRVFGQTDARKLRSSMTLFRYVSREETVFADVLEKYFDGKADHRTINILDSAKF